MGEVEQNETIASMTAELNKLKTIYDEDLSSVEEQIASNTGEYQLTKEVIARLTTEVARIRASIVQ